MRKTIFEIKSNSNSAQTYSYFSMSFKISTPSHCNALGQPTDISPTTLQSRVGIRFFSPQLIISYGSYLKEI